MLEQLNQWNQKALVAQAFAMSRGAQISAAPAANAC
jgi:hypothetical protein